MGLDLAFVVPWNHKDIFEGQQLMNVHIELLLDALDLIGVISGVAFPD